MPGTLLEEPRTAPPEPPPPEDGGGDDGDDGRGGIPPLPPEGGLPISLSRLATLFVLAMVLMLFAGFISGYVILEAGEGRSWPPPEFPRLPFPFYVSTALIALSSGAGFMASRSIRRRAAPRTTLWILATLLLGIGFCLSQVSAWADLWYEGITPRSSNYSGNFYMITVVHALHVLGGVVLLVMCFFRSLRQPAVTSRLEESWGNTMLYWHFVGVIWYVLFALLL